jgi:hypothetical protein
MLITARNITALTLIGGAVAISVSRSPADQPASAPVPAAVPAPTLLEQLSHDTEAAYEKARRGTVVMQLPTRFVERFRLQQEQDQIKNQQDFIDQWSGRLEPQVLQTLKAMQKKSLEDFRRQQDGLTTRPATEDAEAQRHVPFFGKGLLLDRAGNVLIDEYIERGDMPNPVPAQTADGSHSTVAFVGSDEVSRLTVVRLKDPAGDPVNISRGRPHDGALVLAVNPGGGARLVIWTTNHPEPGLIVLPDGSISCFCNPDGRFMAIATAKPVADQLIATGKVHRAPLGVAVREVSKDDPVRAQVQILGQTSALRVLSVKANSAADAGGLKPDDLILTVDGEPVADAPTFAAVIAAKNGTVPLTVLRDSVTVPLTVEMKPAP